MDRFETTEIVMNSRRSSVFGDECDVKIDEDEARLSCEYSSSARIKMLFMRNARNVDPTLPSWRSARRTIREMRKEIQF